MRPRVSQSRRGIPLGAAIGVLVALLTACGGGSGEDRADEPHRLTGHVIAPICGGRYGIESAQIVVHNSTGGILATSTTSANILSPITSPCVVSFSVPAVGGAHFYRLQIGGHSGPAYSQAELEAADFSAVLRLGGTELPNVSANSFCSSAAGLDTLLGSAGALAGDRADWRSGVGSYLDVLTEFAGTQLIGGPDRSAQQLTTVSASLLAATRTPSTTRVQLRTANRLMPGVMRAYGCGDRWATAVAQAPAPPPPAPAPVAPLPPTATVTVTPYTPQPQYGGPPFPGTSLSTALQYQDRTDVSLVQARLNTLGYGPMPVDGSFGPVTRSYVVQYQANHGLIVDGVVGPQTWGSLFP